MSFLQVEAIRKSHDGQEVLHGVDLSVASGTVLALLGASGCGKTTLLRLIAGFEPASSGRITLGGRVLQQPGRFIPAEQRHIGYVPQEGTLFPHLTVADNIGFGLTRAERRSGRIADAMKLTGLDGLADRFPNQISGGQQQRTALARALAPRPALILLDEPFNALDMSLRRSVCADVVAVLRANHATAILVTHDPQEAFDSADLIAVMRNGLVAQCADPATLYRRPVDVAVAELTGPVILLDGQIRGGCADTPLGMLELQPQSPPSGPVIVLLRREQIVLSPDGIRAERLASTFRGDHCQVSLRAGGVVFDIQVPRPEDAAGPGLHVQVRGPCMAYPITR